MQLSHVLQNEIVQILLAIAEITGLIAVTVKVFAGYLWPRVSRGAGTSRKHFERIIALSLANQSYLTACVLILVTRLLTGLFFVVVSLLLFFISLWAGRFDASGLSAPGGGSGLTGSFAQDISVLFVAFSFILFAGNAISATNFSRAVRRGVDAESVKSPFARGFFGLEA